VGDAPLGAPAFAGGMTGVLRRGVYGGGCTAWPGASSGSDLSLKAADFGLGGVGPPWRGVRISSEVAALSGWTRIMLLPVPSSNAARTLVGLSGPYWPKTRSSATPPVILMPVLVAI
jgi:hypothetical protein